MIWVALAVGILLGITATLLYMASRPDSQIRYTGRTDKVSVDFVRYTDYYEFSKEKYSSFATNDPPEKDGAGCSAFLAGNLHVLGEQYQNEDCQIDIVRKGGLDFRAIPFLYKEYGQPTETSGYWDIPFIAYEYDDGHGNTYEEIKLTLDGQTIAEVSLEATEPE